MYPFHHGWGMGGWLIPIILLIILFYLFNEKQKKDTSSAQDILDERYAKGEIDKEEYEERSNTLKKE